MFVFVLRFVSLIVLVSQMALLPQGAVAAIMVVVVVVMMMMMVVVVVGECQQHHPWHSACAECVLFSLEAAVAECQQCLTLSGI